MLSVGILMQMQIVCNWKPESEKTGATAGAGAERESKGREDRGNPVPRRGRAG